jgi:valine--pyruvate aminotransferase
VALSLIGEKMARVSGLRSIMEDIATTTAASTGGSAAGSTGGSTADSGSAWLNLSIGNPAPIPEVIATWRRLTAAALSASFPEASCRYGPSRGMPALVNAIADYFNEHYGWGIGAENIVVGPGSQLLSFIAAALYTGPSASGTTRIVLPMLPDYTGYQGLCMNPGGIAGVAPGVETEGGRGFRYSFDFPALAKRDDIGLLLLSSPSNPTGRCVDAGELATLIALAQDRDVPLLLDHAYGAPFPRIGEVATPPAWHDNVINCFTLSKAGLPGERIGFAIAAERHITPMMSFVANSALHAPQLAQLVVANALRSGQLDTLTSEVISPFYLNRRRLAEKLLSGAMPATVDWRLHTGQGGMFCWLWIDHDWFDDMALYQLLKRKKVFIVPGRHFFVDTPDAHAHSTRCFRISLSADEEVLTEGIRRIAVALEELRATAG